MSFFPLPSLTTPLPSSCFSICHHSELVPDQMKTHRQTLCRLNTLLRPVLIFVRKKGEAEKKRWGKGPGWGRWMGDGLDLEGHSVSSLSSCSSTGNTDVNTGWLWLQGMVVGRRDGRCRGWVEVGWKGETSRSSQLSLTAPLSYPPPTSPSSNTR